MGKMLITNCDYWEEKLYTEFLNIGFKTSRRLSDREVKVDIFKKLAIDSCNFLEEQEDYVACNGTLFYKGLLGENALRALIEDSRKFSIRELRSNMIGSYAVVIKNDNKIRIFVDETYTYSIYYFNKNRFIVSNSYMQINRCICNRVNELALMEDMIRCEIGFESPISDIYKLSSEEYLEIDLDKSVLKLVKCELNDYKKDFSIREEVVDTLYNYLMEISKLKEHNFKKSLLFLTGGIDSRLQLSFSLKNGGKPKIAYWCGKDIITNGASQDLDISMELAKRNNLEFAYYDVSESFKEALHDIKSRRNKYGEYSAIYAGNQKWYEIFEGLRDVDNIDFGFAGELLREIGALDIAYKTNFTISDFIKHVFDRGGIGSNLFYLEGIYDYIRQDLKKFNSTLSDDILSIDECAKLFSCTRFSGDSYLTNFSNMFTYSFQSCFQKKIIDTIFSIPYEWLKDSYIPISLIERIKSDLLDVPIYSHHRSFYYDKRNHIIRKALFFSIVDKLKPILVDTQIYKKLYIGFAHKYIRPKSADNNSILNSCMLMLKDSNIIKESNIELLDIEDWRKLDVAAVAVTVAGIYMMDLEYSLVKSR